MAAADNIIFVSIQILLLTLGSTSVAKLIFHDYKPPKYFEFNNPLYIPHLLFSLTLSSSCTLFLLVFGEIVHLFSNTARSQYWKFNLDILLLLVIVVIPWFQLYAFLHTTQGWKTKPSVYITTVIWILYLYLFSQIEQYSTLAHSTSWIELGIVRISIVGITLISILSGFGVVNTPFNTWSSFKRKVSEQDYTVAERAYKQTEAIIHEKKALLERMYKQEELSDKKEKPKSATLFGKMSSIFSGSEDSETVLLQIEIEQLEGLALNMKSDLDELERGRAKSRFSQTWKGKIWKIVDLIFAVYCIYKLIVTTFNVIFQRTGSSDPITKVLSIMMSHLDRNNLDFKIDPVFWSQQLSFWFAGIIVFGSVRGFLKLLTRLLRVFMHKVTFSTSSILLFAAHMMGMYFLSSVLMMQMSLPAEYRYLISSSLHSVEFVFFQHWSDIIFVASSFISACIIYVIYQTHDAKSMATDFADLELMSVESGFDRRE
ncbi:Abscisic acid G-protein coupled receptor-domain-containing protein [Mucor mucedo]|uniref:Abscisic acid G-protein coupled receptor-domain-containing protein n=1 Tax=Mucor mucedo TaxID=29922 RepID=UPI00221E8FEE|nr:Abscisic acid G-protein coupled receptor-domain-containing protein [Mucor mucedo]KAI7868199.1 Abscisic acid G-protein coupled receptor-domain-containing protein [Mucor mucedo]